MRILLLCPHFDPDVSAATGQIMTTLSRALHRRGHAIDVVTSLPWYQNHGVDTEWKGRPWRSGETDVGRIVRVWPFPSGKTNIPARAAGYFGFSGLVATAAQTMDRPDVVMAVSPPIFLGDAGWMTARRHRPRSDDEAAAVPFVFNVQDIFPDVAIELGALTNDRLIEGLKRHERSVYRRADAITVLSDDQADNVRAKLDPATGDKVEVIKNFADVDGISPLDRDTECRRRLGLGEKTIVQYSGNLGFSQPFELIRQAADAFADRPDVHFLINGEGAARPDIDSWAGDRSNVSVIDFVSAGQVPDVLATADLHLIPLRAGLARSSTPSKLYGILAAGRPALASIDRGSEVWNTLEAASAGRSVEPDDPVAFLEVLDQMLSDPELLQQMGQNGRKYVEARLSPDSQAEAYEALFLRLLAAPSGRSAPPDSSAEI